VVKKIFFVMFIVLLCFTATNAWIIVKNEKFAKSFSINYPSGTLVIADKKVKVSLWITPDGENAKPIEISNSDRINENGQYLVNNVVPGKSINFTLKLQNTSNDEVPVNISIGRLVCDESLIGDEKNPKVSLELSDITFNKYPIAKNPGAKSYMISSENMLEVADDVYTISLYEGLYIPPTGDDWIEIQCRLVFSAELGNEYQNKTFRIDSIKVVE